MIAEVRRVARELEIAQGRAARLTQHLCVLTTMREGDRVRARFEFGGHKLEKTGVVRVMSDTSFFLELSSGALLMVEGAEFIEILSSSSTE